MPRLSGVFAPANRRVLPIRRNRRAHQSAAVAPICDMHLPIEWTYANF